MPDPVVDVVVLRFALVCVDRAPRSTSRRAKDAVELAINRRVSPTPRTARLIIGKPLVELVELFLCLL